MSRAAIHLSVWLSLLGCIGTAGCQAAGSRAGAMPQRVTPQEAAARIEQALTQALGGGDRLVVRETTPEGLFEALGTQTFRIVEGDRTNDTWAVTAAQAVALGTGYGGPGVVTFHLGDVDGNGAPDLAYAFGSGAGVVRFEVGIYDRPGDPLRGQARTRRVPLSYRNPLRFAVAADGLEVWDASRNQQVGLITAAGDDLRFNPANPLPQGVRDRLLEPRLR